MLRERDSGLTPWRLARDAPAAPRCLTVLVQIEYGFGWRDIHGSDI